MQCWNCEEETMETSPIIEKELGKRWFECSNCGATWISLVNFRSASKGRKWSKKRKDIEGGC